MSRLWWFAPWFGDEPVLERFGWHCAFANDEEMRKAHLEMGKRAPSDFPIAQLKLSLENFSLDCFRWQAYRLVSQQLRDAMALAPRDVQYLPVNASLSAPLPRSKNYMIMHVPAVEDASDVERSDYQIRHFEGFQREVTLPSRIAIRQGFMSQHEMFQDQFFWFVLCTDALAVRVLQRQCTGLRFCDLDYLDNPSRFRTLRGIEEEIRDPANSITSTRLVQTIG